MNELWPWLTLALLGAFTVGVDFVVQELIRLILG